MQSVFIHTEHIESIANTMLEMLKRPTFEEALWRVIFDQTKPLTGEFRLKRFASGVDLSFEIKD